MTTQRLSFRKALLGLRREKYDWTLNPALSSGAPRVLLSTALVLLVLASLFLSSFVMHSAAGQPVGLVCLAPASANACPAPPVTMGGSVGGQLMVAVLVQGSDIFNGFDITLKANHTILVPASVSVAGSLLAGGSTVLECVGGVLKAGPVCSPTDTMDTLHLVLAGPPGFFTFAPASGLLFTAIYNITSTTTTSIGYQTGCSPSSVTGTSTCVLFTNGSTSFPAETVQTATYTKSPTPTFTIGSSRSEMSLTKGETANSTIILVSLNGFAGTVSLSVAATPTVKHPPSFSFSPSIVTLTAGGFNTALLVVSADNNTTKATYNVAVTGTGGSVSGSVVIQVSITP